MHTTLAHLHCCTLVKCAKAVFESTAPPFNRLNGSLASNTWSAISPRLGLKYRSSPQFGAYAAYGKGFRASILDDLCRSGILWGIYKIANPHLKPEKIDSFEVGFNVSPIEKLTVDTSIMLADR